MLKVYLFSWINKPERYDDDLFAFTTDKEMAKLFKRARNMKMFKCKKYDLTHAEFNHLRLDHTYKSLVVEKLLSLNDDYEEERIEVAITTNEAIELERMSIRADRSIARASFHPMIMLQDYRVPLFKLQYAQYYTMQNDHLPNAYLKEYQMESLHPCVYLNELNTLITISKESFI